jgi:hypothetical protein
VAPYAVEDPLPLWPGQARTRLDSIFVWGATANSQVPINGGIDIKVCSHGNINHGCSGSVVKLVTIRDYEYPCTAFTARPSSGHSNVVVVSFADGRTQLLNEDISYIVYQSLMTPDNSKSNMPNAGYLLKSEDYTN